MILTFQPTGASSATKIADYTATPRILGIFAGDFGLDSIVQIKKRYNSAAPYKSPRFNAAGVLPVVTRCSQSSYDNASTYFKNMLALVTQQGALIYKPTSSAAITFTFANAICKSCVRLASGDMEGIGVALRWSFEYTTIT